MTQEQLKRINRLVEAEVKSHPLFRVFQDQGFWGDSVEVQCEVSKALRGASGEELFAREHLRLELNVLYRGVVVVQMGCSFELDEDEMAFVLVTRQRLDNAINLILSSGLLRLTTNL